MDLDAAIAILMGADRETVVKALEQKAGPIHQAVFQKGHDVGYGKKTSELTTALERATAAEGHKTRLEGELAEARKGQPDLEKIHAQYKGQIEELTTKHQQEVERVTGTLTTERQGSHLTNLRARLIAKGVDKDFAEVLTERTDVRKRVSVDAEGKLQILQAGKEIPIAVSGEMSPLDVLVDELFKSVDPKFVASGGDTGSGDRGPTPSKGGDQLYDGIRKEVTELGKSEAGGRDAALKAAGIA